MENKIFLLADDDSDDTEMFSEALAGIDKNIICHIVSDGREMFNLLSTLVDMPDLIFLDVNMPVMNGWQCLKLLKEDERYNQIPVIIFSTSSHQRDMDIAADLGALCYFTKPNDFNELAQVLRVITSNLGPGLRSAIKNMHSNISQFIYACSTK